MLNMLCLVLPLSGAELNEDQLNACMAFAPEQAAPGSEHAVHL